MSLTVASIMAILGGLASAGGAVASASRNKKTEDSLLGQKSDLDREYYEGVLDDPGSQAYLKEIERISRDNVRGIENSVVSTGSTAENRLAQMNDANEVVDKAVSGLLQKEENRNERYFAQRNNVNAQLGNLRAQQAQNWMNIAQNVAKSAGALGEAYLDDGGSLLGGGGGSEETAPSLQDRLTEDAAKASVETQQTALDNSIRDSILKRDVDKLEPQSETRYLRAQAANDGRTLERMELAPQPLAAERPKALDNNILPGDDVDEDDPTKKKYTQA